MTQTATQAVLEMQYMIHLTTGQHADNVPFFFTHGYNLHSRQS